MRPFESESFGNQEHEKLQALAALRKSAQARIPEEVRERMQTNPFPTLIEVQMGCLVEELDPPVREAMVELNRKGYQTQQSGFSGQFGEYQFFDGYFELDPSTRNLLTQRHDVTVDERETVKIFSQEPDLAVIRQQVLEVVALIPERTGTKLQPDRIAANFVRTFAPDNFALELVLTAGDRSYQYFAYDEDEHEWWSGVEYFDELEDARRSATLQSLSERYRTEPPLPSTDLAKLHLIVEEITDQSSYRLSDELETLRYQLEQYFGPAAKEHNAYQLLCGVPISAGGRLDDFPGNLVSRFLTRCRLLLDTEPRP